MISELSTFFQWFLITLYVMFTILNNKDVLDYRQAFFFFFIRRYKSGRFLEAGESQWGCQTAQRQLSLFSSNYEGIENQVYYSKNIGDVDVGGRENKHKFFLWMRTGPKSLEGVVDMAWCR